MEKNESLAGVAGWGKRAGGNPILIRQPYPSRGRKATNITL
jgi:hypothetical protein